MKSSTIEFRSLREGDGWVLGWSSKELRYQLELTSGQVTGSAGISACVLRYRGSWPYLMRALLSKFGTNSALGPAVEALRHHALATGWMNKTALRESDPSN